MSKPQSDPAVLDEDVRSADVLVSFVLAGFASGAVFGVVVTLLWVGVL